MKTWEAFQYNKKIGKTRIRLAKMIEAAIPGLFLNPEDLQTQNPQFSRAEVDACNWDAWGTLNGRKVHFYSWSPMGEIVKAGKLKVKPDGPSAYDIDPDES